MTSTAVFPGHVPPKARLEPAPASARMARKAGAMCAPLEAWCGGWCEDHAVRCKDQEIWCIHQEIWREGQAACELSAQSPVI